MTDTHSSNQGPPREFGRKFRLTDQEFEAAKKILASQGLLRRCPLCGSQPAPGEFGEWNSVDGEHDCRQEHSGLLRWVARGGDVTYYDADLSGYTATKFTQAVTRWVTKETYKRGIGLTLLGPPGCGKTAAGGLPCWKAWNLNWGRSFGIVRFRDILAKPDDPERRFFAPQLLLIDDLGSPVSPAQQEFFGGHLFEVVDERYRRPGHATLVTANMSIDDLTDAYPKVADRLRERTIIVDDPNAPSFRSQPAFWTDHGPPQVAPSPSLPTTL